MTHEEMILKAHDELSAALPETVTDEGRAFIERAFIIAKEAHAGQIRKSGLPYILHPLTVALIVVKELRQDDPAVIAAAILHDVVEDTPYTIANIRTLFGDDVAFLVGAVTKPNKNQADNFQHILGSVKGDVRVLVLKLSDRLHNMRTLESMSPRKQWKIASETQFFYAPLAGCLGLYDVKAELEDLAFQYLNPNEYARIGRLLKEDRERTRGVVESFVRECGEAVAGVLGDAVEWTVRYRRPYPLWRDMKEQGCDFFHVPKHYIRATYDMDAVGGDRTELQVALDVYSTLSGHYREPAGSLVNYISMPKSNGYRAIHFRLLNPLGSIEEFHVASRGMREQARYGCLVESRQQWMKRLTSVLDELAGDPESMMPGIHDSLFNEDVVAYTPKGKAITLPKGATALDFAYEVHTDIGGHAKCARINGHLSGIRTVLRRGDCVEVITDEAVHPVREWLDAVVTYKAKKHIRAFLELLPAPAFTLCPHCRPLPESPELIGFDDGLGHVTVHSRNCPDAIRSASEQGNRIVEVDFKSGDGLYPVCLQITAIDRYHLLQDILECIVENLHLSMSGLTSSMKDYIVTCTIDFSVHSATERVSAISRIATIDGVEEVNEV